MSDWEQGVHTGLQVERDGHVAIVTLSNPPANTWTVHSLAALRDLVRALDADRSIYALVISGEGEKFFSAGADLKQFADGDKANAREAARRFGEAFEALSAFRGVAIAAINGYAMGAGWSAHWPAIYASPSSKHILRCPKPVLVCCHVQAVPRICRAWSAKAGPSA